MSLVGAVVATTGWAIVLSGNGSKDVDPAFYVAAATILPVLLLALLLRIGQAREQVSEIGGDVDWIREKERKLAAQLAPVRAEMEGIRQALGRTDAPDWLLQQLHDLEAKVGDLSPVSEAELHLGARLHRLSELHFASLILALVVGPATLGAALITLATGNSTRVGLAVTISGLIWMVLEIAALEIFEFGTRAWTNKP